MKSSFEPIMNTMTEHKFIARSAEEMQQLGYDIGIRLKAAAVLRLNGDLGSGKTCFVQGLAKGLGVPEGYYITSPTYALIHGYPGRLPLVHVDLYRIHDESDAESIGLWELIDEENVVAVEWADRLEDAYWPTSTLTVEIKIADDETRHIRLIGSGLQMVDLIKEVF